MRQPVEVAQEVADQAVHAQPGVGGAQLGGALANDALGHVDRDVARERPRRRHRVEQQPGLRGAPRAQLDELGGGARGDDVPGVAFEDQPLGARRVVLLQLADLVEERGAVRVVEVLGRELLLRARQPLAGVLGERRARVARERVVDLDHAVGPHAPSTRRPCSWVELADAAGGEDEERAVRSAGRPSQRASRTRSMWPWENSSTVPSLGQRRRAAASARAPTSCADSPSGQPSRQRSQPGRRSLICALVSPS